jgi:hypothetical protein
VPSIVFRLMFPITEVEQWASQYSYRSDDTKAFEAGKKILAGDYSRSTLEIIVGWKSERRKALVAQNSDSEIEDALRLALSAKEPRSALAVLMGLCGVALPMASAILTALDQDKHTIADWRAMEALGQPNADYYNLNLYLRNYLPTCKRLAAEAGVSLRVLDKAMWTWSEKKGNLDQHAKEFMATAKR